MNLAQQKFSTSEGLLAFCLYLAGCELSDPNAICFHIYTPEILSTLGLKGEKLWDGAQRAWLNKARGHVEYSFILSQRCNELIQAYREQREELKESDDKASDLVLKIMQSASAGAMLPDEAILRIACVNLKIRSEFMNAWKTVVPLLKVPAAGKTRRFDSTVTIRGKDGAKTLPAKAVEKPGYKLISLNASEETKRKMGFA